MLCNVCFNFRSTNNQHHLLKPCKGLGGEEDLGEENLQVQGRTRQASHQAARRTHYCTASQVQTPGLPCNIAPVEKPDKDLLIEEHATRFAHRDV